MLLYFLDISILWLDMNGTLRVLVFMTILANKSPVAESTQEDGDIADVVVASERKVCEMVSIFSRAILEAAACS